MNYLKEKYVLITRNVSIFRKRHVTVIYKYSLQSPSLLCNCSTVHKGKTKGFIVWGWRWSYGKEL